MQSRKKGSALVMVLVITAVLLIIGTSMIALSVSNFRMRTVKSDLKTNFYASEAGLDEAYGIIGEKIDEAIGAGNNAVKAFMDGLNLEAEIQKEEEKIEGTGSPYVNDDLSINEGVIKDKQNEKFRREFVKTLINSSYVPGDQPAKEQIHLFTALEDAAGYKFTQSGKKPVISVQSLAGISTVDFKSYEKQQLLTVRVKSTFNLKGLEKILTADYIVYVPKYEDQFLLESNHVKLEKNPVWTKIIAADGNLKISGNNLAVNGDIYIKGANDGSSVKGIDINAAGADNIEFTGTVATSEDFSISSSSKPVVNGNIYAKNVNLQDGATSAELTVNKLNGSGGSVYTSDDLQIDAMDSKVTIHGGYYGLTDGSNSSSAQQSSTIAINAVDDDKVRTSLTIDGESIIMGTAYVNAVRLDTDDERYQTGESLSVKGNYRAYTYPLTMDRGDNRFSEDNVEYDYYSALGVNYLFKFVTDYWGKDENEETVLKKLTPQDKSRYIKYFNEENSGILKYNGIHVDENNSIRIGSIQTQEGKILEEKFNLNDWDKVNAVIDQFKKIVYYMGDVLQNKNVITPQITVQSQVNFNKIPSGNFVKDYGQDGVVILIGGQGEYTLNPSDRLSVEGNTININNTKGIIIVDGSLNISAPINFTGTILARNNINISQNTQKYIKYDKSTVKKLIAKEQKLFSDIFTNNSTGYENVTVDPKLETLEPLMQSSTLKDKLIRVGNWTIVK